MYCKLPNSSTKIFVDILFFEAQFVKHTDEEAILFLRVVFAFVTAVDETQLMEWGSVSSHLKMLFKNVIKLIKFI